MATIKAGSYDANIKFEEDNTLYIAETMKEVVVTAKRYTKKEIQAAEKCACGEAEGEGLLGQILVVNVIQNRMERRDRSLLQVVYRKDQFDGMKSKRPVTDSCKKAVRMALYEDIRLIPKDIVYFHNPGTATNKKHVNWLERDKVFWGKYKKHSFYSYKDKENEITTIESKKSVGKLDYEKFRRIAERI